MIDPAPLYRKQILDALQGEEFDSIIELGCDEGYNLMAIDEKYPKLKNITGIDIAEENRKIGKIDIICADATDLKNIPDKSYDIAFTYAFLTVVNTKTTMAVINNLFRIAKFIVIIIELDGEEWYTSDSRYSRNYTKILNNLGYTKIAKKLIPKYIWAGKDYPSYGKIIKVFI